MFRPGIAVILALGACGRIGFDARADAGTADGAVDATPLGPWGAVTPVTITNLTVSVDDPTLTDDRLLLIANLNFDLIGVATRSSPTAPWGEMTEEMALTSGDETEPHMAPDGLGIYYASARTGTIGGFDVYASTRASRGVAWSPPTRVAELSSTVDDLAGASTADGLLIPVTRGADPREIWLATRTSTTVPWGAPALLTEINSADDEAGAHLSADGLALYFYSTRNGDEDLFVATRASRAEPFGTPQPITELNSASEDTDPWVSSDQRHIVFASYRDGPSALYEASR